MPKSNGTWKWISGVVVVALVTAMQLLRASDLKPIEAHLKWSATKNEAQDSSISHLNTQTARDRDMVIRELKALNHNNQLIMDALHISPLVRAYVDTTQPPSIPADTTED